MLGIKTLIYLIIRASEFSLAKFFRRTRRHHGPIVPRMPESAKSKNLLIFAPPYSVHFCSRPGMLVKLLPRQEKNNRARALTRAGKKIPRAGERRSGDVIILLCYWRIGAAQAVRLPTPVAALVQFFVYADLGAFSVFLASILAGGRSVGQNVLDNLVFRPRGCHSRIRSDVGGWFRCSGCADSDPRERGDQERKNIHHARLHCVMCRTPTLTPFREDSLLMPAPAHRSVCAGGREQVQL